VISAANNHHAAFTFRKPLAELYFAMQSQIMETKWAAENLHTIRTLMERSAVYRRALAPVMTYVGIIGLVGGIVGWRLFENQTLRAFVVFWVSLACAALAGSLILIRRQAFRSNEPVWTPPARRIAQSMFPAFLIGLIFAVFDAYIGEGVSAQEVAVFLVIAWLWTFGCAIHSASFFLARGIKLLSWGFILAGCGLFAHFATITHSHSQWVGLERTPHLLMAATFGGLHLAYGFYLYFTEPKNPAA
jgi:hypothetical protein